MPSGRLDHQIAGGAAVAGGADDHDDAEEGRHDAQKQQEQVAPLVEFRNAVPELPHRQTSLCRRFTLL